MATSVQKMESMETSRNGCDITSYHCSKQEKRKENVSLIIYFTVILSILTCILICYKICHLTLTIQKSCYQFQIFFAMLKEKKII